MDRRSTLLGLTSGVVTGPELMQNLQGWLSAFDKNTIEGQKNLSSHMGKLGNDHIELLQLSARKLYDSYRQYGGGDMNHKIAINLLHEVSAAVREKQAPIVQQDLYNIMANLARTIAKLSWHAGLEVSAQNYYQLALRAAHASNDRLFGAMILTDHAVQMYYLGKFQDGLYLIQLAQHSIRNVTRPQMMALLTMYEAWGYAGLGQEPKFQQKINLSEKYLTHIKTGQEPYWVSFCDTGELAATAGLSFRLLAMHKPAKYAEEASELKVKAITLRDKSSSRYSALDYIGLAESRFLLKDTELAVSSTEQALVIYDKLQNRCGATRRRLYDIYQYTNQASKSKELQALNTKLKSVLAIA